MANIVLKIGSTFNGEGLQRLQNGVRQANAHVSKGIAVGNQLAGAMSAVDTSASRTATAAGGLVQAFAQGGVAGAAFAAVTMVINAKIKSMQEELEKTKKEAADLEAKLNKGFSENLASRIASAVANAKELGTEFERTAKHAEQVTAAINGLASAQAKGGIIALETEKLNATMGEMDESLRKTIAAAYDLEIAEARLAAVEADGAAKTEEARKAYLTQQKRIENINEQIASIDNDIAIQKKTAASIEQADAAKAAEIRKALQTLEKERAALVEKQKDAVSASTALEIKYQTAQQEAENAAAEKAIAVKQAAEAERLAKKSAEELAAAESEKAKELEAKEAEAKRAEAINENKSNLADATKQLTDARSAAADAEREIQAAEQKLVQAIENYNANLGQNMTQDVLRNYWSENNPGKTLQNPFGEVMKNIPKIGEAAGKAAGQAAVEQGKVRTVGDLRRIENAAARAERIAAYQDGAAASMDDITAARIAAKSEKARSPWERKFMEDYEATQESRNKNAAEVQAARWQKNNAEMRKQKAEQAMIDMKKDIEKIQQQLEKLGLK